MQIEDRILAIEQRLNVIERRHNDRVAAMTAVDEAAEEEDREHIQY